MSDNKAKVTAQAGQQEIVVTREFDAPVALLFKVSMDPAHISDWWGPRKYKTEVDKMEVKPGGIWRFINKDATSEHAFHGVFHEILEPKRVINTFEYEGLAESGHVVLETKKFEALSENKSRLTILSVFQSVADRDGMLQSGMEEGLSISLDRLEELLKKV